MMTSSALHRARGATAGIRATGFAHCGLGLDMWFTPQAAQVSMPYWMSFTHRTQAYDHQWLYLCICFRQISCVFYEFSRDIEWLTAAAMFCFLLSFIALIPRRTT